MAIGIWSNVNAQPMIKWSVSTAALSTGVIIQFILVFETALDISESLFPSPDRRPTLHQKHAILHRQVEDLADLFRMGLRERPAEHREVLTVDDDRPPVDRRAPRHDAVAEEREEDERIWGSMIKQAIKRRNPGFNERAYGFRSFNDLLLEAQKRGLLKLEPDEKSGGYTVQAVE
jgi:hypothetical protein